MGSCSLVTLLLQKGRDFKKKNHSKSKILKVFIQQKTQTSFVSFFVRKVNGPGTPRPLSRPKVSLANSLAANGLPDSTDNKDINTEQEEEDKDSRYV